MNSPQTTCKWCGETLFPVTNVEGVEWGSDKAYTCHCSPDAEADGTAGPHVPLEVDPEDLPENRGVATWLRSMLRTTTLHK